MEARPSKSAAHRLILAAALAKGESEICGIDLSEDIKATLSAAKALGAEYEYESGNIKIKSRGADFKDGITVDCRESGSTLRFLIPIFLTGESRVLLTGARRLFERPLGVYEKICKEEGLTFEKGDNSLILKGPLRGGKYVIDGNISSQFITGFLFALPLLKTDSEIKINPPIESRPYIEMTLETLKKAGIKVDFSGNDIYIYGNQRYSPLREETEKDWSNAAFLEAMNLAGGDVCVTGLNENSKQGDKIYREFFTVLEKNSLPKIDITDFPDLAPVLMAVAAIKNGVVLTGTRRLRFKESDRGKAMSEELEKFGTETVIEEDRITVKQGNLCFPTDVLSSHNDHRIAMALSVIMTVTGGTLNGAEAVFKSYPGYWEDIKKLGIEVIYE